jgi:hypothetical protein
MTKTLLYQRADKSVMPSNSKDRLATTIGIALTWAFPLMRRCINRILCNMSFSLI